MKVSVLILTVAIALLIAFTPAASTAPQPKMADFEAAMGWTGADACQLQSRCIDDPPVWQECNFYMNAQMQWVCKCTRTIWAC